MPDLTTQQEAALRVITWLCNTSASERGQGRTTVVAIALIRQALANPGIRTPIRDLGSTSERDGLLVSLIQDLIDTDRNIAGRLHVSRGASFIRYDGTERLFDWLPSGWQHSAQARRRNSQLLPHILDLGGGSTPSPRAPADDAVRAESVVPQSVWQRLDDD